MTEQTKRDINTNKLILKATGDVLKTPVVTPCSIKTETQPVVPEQDKITENLIFEIY